MEKIIALAKKLNELAKKGIGGEKTNAEEMLTKFLKKHNLTLSDVEGEKIEHHWFKLDKRKDEQLFCQITHSVNRDIKIYGEFPAKDVKRLQMEGNYFIDCTLAEFIEIDAKFNIYSKLYKEELNTFYHAFCTANDLLVRPKEQINASELNMDDFQKLVRIRKMAANIKTHQYKKQLPG
jgi:hypothetical protein